MSENRFRSSVFGGFNRRDVAWVKVHLEFDESELEDDVPQE